MIKLQNPKAGANLQTFQFFDEKKEWNLYCKEFPERVAKAVSSPEDRFNGKTTVEAFAQSVEYIPRSLIPRPLQYFIALKLIWLLRKENRYRVLDYGAGAGNMGMIFAHMGFKTDFLDVEGALTDFLKWRVDKHFFNSKVFNHVEGVGKNKYDLVCLQNVLEHLDDPMLALKRIANAIPEGGYFFITFNTTEKGLDVVTWKQYEDEIKPFILKNFEVVPDTDNMLYKRI